MQIYIKALSYCVINFDNNLYFYRCDTCINLTSKRIFQFFFYYVDTYSKSTSSSEKKDKGSFR